MRSADEGKTLAAHLEALQIEGTHPLFAHHVRSLRALVESEEARSLLYPVDSVLPNRIHEDFEKIGKGLNQGNDRWEAYRVAGMPLVMAYLSPRDGTVQLYYLVLPRNWDEQKSYPLYVELHGSGGAEIRPLGWAGMTLENAPDFEAGHSKVHMYPMVERDGFHLLPYGRGNSDYVDIGAIDVHEAMDDLAARVKIDHERQYLFGFSMGGSGTYHLASDEPDRWAAIAIMGGSPGLRDAEVSRAEKLRNIPVFLWSGMNDEWFDGAQRKAEALEATGARPRRIKFSPGVGHDYPGEIQKEAHHFMQQFTRADLR